MQQFMLNIKMLNIKMQMSVPNIHAVLQIALIMRLKSTPLQIITNLMTSVQTSTQAIC